MPRSCAPAGRPVIRDRPEITKQKSGPSQMGPQHIFEQLHDLCRWASSPEACAASHESLAVHAAYIKRHAVDHVATIRSDRSVAACGCGIAKYTWKRSGHDFAANLVCDFLLARSMTAERRSRHAHLSYPFCVDPCISVSRAPNFIRSCKVGPKSTIGCMNTTDFRARNPLDARDKHATEESGGYRATPSCNDCFFGSSHGRRRRRHACS